MTSYKSKQRLAAEVLPVDGKELSNRRSACNWFDGKKYVFDAKWIHDWLNSAIANDDDVNEKELEYIEHSGEVARKLHRNVSLHLRSVDEASYIENSVKHCATKSKHIVNNPGLTSPMNKNTTVAIGTSSDNDSVDTAEYIRGARGKGNKSFQNKNNLIKQHAYINNIEPITVARSVKIQPHISSGISCNSNIQIKRKRLQKRGSNKVKKRKAYATSSSSSEGISRRYQNDSRSARNLIVPRTLSEKETDNSDPDDKILDNIRKKHKVNTPVQDIVK